MEFKIMNELKKFQVFMNDLSKQGLNAHQIKAKGQRYIQGLSEEKQAQLSAAFSTQKTVKGAK
tara:strand:- start:431 stop:619 length:189 start_codon:yes stop_codon:yes gene_type:complete